MTLTILMIGIPGLLLLAALAFPLTSRPAACATLVMVCYLIETTLLTQPGISLGLTIYPTDVAFALMFVAMVLRYAMGQARLNSARSVMVFLFLLYLLALVRGFARYGVKLPGVEGRGMFYYFTGLLYFGSFQFRARMRASILNVWIVSSLLLVVIIVLRWAAVIAGLGIVATWQEAYGVGFRVVNAESASVLAMAFFASMFMHTHRIGPLWQRNLHYLFGPMVLLLQHRTVWGMMLIGFLWLGTQEKRFRRQAIAGFVMLAVLGAVASLFLFGSRTAEMLASLQYAASNEDTFFWRLAGWYQLVFTNHARTLFNDILGQPFGTGFPRWIGGEMVDTAPHNYYLEFFLRLGVVGLGVWLWLYRWGVRRMKRLARALPGAAFPDPRFWALVLILQLVYSIGYGIPYEQSILTGVALAGLGLHSPSPAKAQPAKRASVPHSPSATDKPGEVSA